MSHNHMVTRSATFFHNFFFFFLKLFGFEKKKLLEMKSRDMFQQLFVLIAVDLMVYSIIIISSSTCTIQALLFKLGKKGTAAETLH